MVLSKVVAQKVISATVTGLLLLGYSGVTQVYAQHAGKKKAHTTASAAPAFIVNTIQEIDVNNGTAKPPIKSENPYDVYSGEEVEVIFDRPVSSVSVSVDDNKETTPLEPIKATAGNTWRMFIPSFSSQALPVAMHSFTFSGNLPGEPTTPTPPAPPPPPPLTLAVYPAPNAQITGIEPTTVAMDASGDTSGSKEYITLHGDGFFAPPGNMHLYIGRTTKTTKETEAKIQYVSPDGKLISAVLESKPPNGQQPVRLEIWNTTAKLKDVDAGEIEIVNSGVPQWSLVIALITFVVLTVAILFLVGSKRSLRLPRFLEVLLVEKTTNSYSLSYFQFYWWGGIIVLGWLFIFATRGFVSDDWQFPDLSGFAYTFLISLTTLVAAQATNSAKGNQGSGPVNPSLSDLVMNGGIPAPERIQNLVWTLVGGVVYVVIIYHGYQEVATLPTIPNELLVLMGISSAGYIGGKLARKPGPIITQIVTTSDRTIEIHGVHLSLQPHLWLDEQELPQTAITKTTKNLELPTEFATALEVTLPPLPAFPWYDPQHQDQQRHILLVNVDGQRSEWMAKPQAPPVPAGGPPQGARPATVGTPNPSMPALPTVTAVTPAQPVAAPVGEGTVTPESDSTVGT